MANTIITQEDLQLVLQQNGSGHSPKILIEVMDAERKILGVIHGIVSGTMQIRADSDLRRTCGLTVRLAAAELRPQDGRRPEYSLQEQMKLSEESLLWLDKDIKLSVGLFNPRTKEYKYYPLGYYVYTDTSTTCNGTANEIVVNCADFIKKLDGTRNGQTGALLTRFPAYEESETGEVIKYNSIRDTVITILEQLCHITNYRIDDIGDHLAMPEFSAGWEIYRSINFLWNTIPFDQEFTAGTTALAMLTAFRDLYPNYEMFFDPEDNQFICQLIPGCYEDDLFLDDTFLQQVLISENSQTDLTLVRNICEVCGSVIKNDFYTETCSYTDNTYICAVQSFTDKYCNGDVVAVKIPAANGAGARININNLGPVEIRNEFSVLPILPGRLSPDNIYAFRFERRNVNKEDIVTVYLVGKWQVHGLNVLVDGRENNEIYTDRDGNTCKLYSEEYFRKKYNCESVLMTVIRNSPFTVQQIGEILDVKSGGDYNKTITSDGLALAAAQYENWKNSRLTDNITITTALLLFLDVNKKVSYRPHNCETERQYIVKSISHDFGSFTSTITMCRFYPLYDTVLAEMGTHKALSWYTHGVNGKYTHDELTRIVQGEDI